MATERGSYLLETKMSQVTWEIERCDEKTEGISPGLLGSSDKKHGGEGETSQKWLL